jgi:hypothetical protein
MEYSQKKKIIIIGSIELIYSMLVIILALSGIFYNTEFLHYLSNSILVLGLSFLLAGILIIMDRITLAIGFTIIGVIVNIYFWMVRYETIFAFILSVIPLLCLLSTIYIRLYDTPTP